MQANIQTNIHFQIGVINSIVRNLYLVDILDAILNFCQGLMMSRVDYFDYMISAPKSQEAQKCIPNTYMVHVKHLKSLKKKKTYFGSHLGSHP